MFEGETNNNNSGGKSRYQERLESFSSTFELGIFIEIARKTVIWVVLLFILAYTSATLYLRYTQPVFESSSILQVQTNSDARRFLDIADDNDRTNLSRVVELLRSKVFFRRVLSNLPLQYSYFSEGTFIASELYTSSPYEVELKNVKTDFNGIRIYVDFISRREGIINYTINDVNHVLHFVPNKWVASPHFIFKINIKNYNAIEKQQSIVKSNSFFFNVNDIDKLVNDYYPNLTVGVLNERAGTIQMTFKGLNPNKAAAIVSMMGSEYDSFEVEQKGGSSNSIIDFIDDQLAVISDRLKLAEGSLRDFEKKHNISESNKKVLNLEIDLLNDLENDLIAIDLNDAYLSKIETAINNYKNIDTYSLLSLLGESTQKFGGTLTGGGGKSKQDIYKERMHGLTNVEEITKLLLQKEEMLYTVRPESEVIKALDFQLGIQLKVLKENIKTMKVSNDIQRDEIKDQLREVRGTNGDGTVSEVDLEYTQLQRSFSINEKYYMLLIEKKTHYSISKAGFVSQNVLLQKGNIPDVPISPNKATAFGISFFLALLFSIGIILIRYLLHDQIGSLGEISKHLSASIPVLGMIPKSSIEIPSSQLIVDKNPKSILAEAFRSVRSNMQFISNEEGAKVIAVTSTISGEGKTFVAINLAGILAFSGKKVVLIDLDMRKPKIHIGFKVENTKGMSTLLIGKDKLDDCVQQSSLDNLHFITAGPIPPNPSELVISKKMDELILHLKTIYDIIVIDNPPVGIVSDGIAMINKADFPIYIFRANYSKRSFIHNVDRLYNEGKMHKLSIILNGVDVQRKTYGYNYGYGYGYGYGSNNGYYDDLDTRSKKSLFRKK
jgi:tyrosine-protein kinase Etk/Wzc